MQYIEILRPEEIDYVSLYVDHLNTMNEMFQNQRWVQTEAITSDVFRMITIMREMQYYLNHIISQGKCVPEQVRTGTAALSAAVTHVCAADWECVDQGLADFHGWLWLKDLSETLSWDVLNVRILRIHPWVPWM